VVVLLESDDIVRGENEEGRDLRSSLRSSKAF
jgi:hypothetical protein